jgi:uncharacterized hydrophobic protein (TIGR00341 family)
VAIRLLTVLVPGGDRREVEALLEEHGDFPMWWSELGGGGAELHVLIPAEGNDPILEALRSHLEELEGFRMVLLPVQATVPRIGEWPAEDEDEEVEGKPDGEEEEKTHDRINVEELYTSMSDDARTTNFYLVMVALSSVVACAGLMMGDTAVIIGAMVIAPLLGPNMALAFATTLGDLKLLRSAWWAASAGALVALAVSVLAGIVLAVDPEGVEIASRTRVGAGHVALALAAGAAGALSLTRGVAAGLVGVMVAVALLPPLAAAGLLLGDGHWEAGIGAVLLVAANIASVNLAGIGTFLIQGVRPRLLWEKGRARRATIIAVSLWAGLVAALLLVVWLAWD